MGSRLLLDTKGDNRTTGYNKCFLVRNTIWKRLTAALFIAGYSHPEMLYDLWPLVAKCVALVLEYQALVALPRKLTNRLGFLQRAVINSQQDGVWPIYSKESVNARMVSPALNCRPVLAYGYFTACRQGY
jgi:hypothetical protein